MKTFQEYINFREALGPAFNPNALPPPPQNQQQQANAATGWQNNGIQNQPPQMVGPAFNGQNGQQKPLGRAFFNQNQLNKSKKNYYTAGPSAMNPNYGPLPPPPPQASYPV